MSGANTQEAIRLVVLTSDPSSFCADLEPRFAIVAVRNPDEEDLEGLQSKIDAYLISTRDPAQAKLWLEGLKVWATGVPRLVRIPALSGPWPEVALDCEAFLVGELSVEEAYLRYQASVSASDAFANLVRAKTDAEVMVELTQALSSALDFREILYTVVRRVAEVVDVERASVVVAPETRESDVAYVVVASDDVSLTNLRIDLRKYPEVRRVLESGESLIVRDIASDPLFDEVRGDLAGKSEGVRTLLPISYREQVIGVLFLRGRSEGSALARPKMRLCQTIANATAVALRNARVMQSLRDQTQRVTFARFEAEQRLQELHRYADTFASAAEGIAVIGRDGHLLFANPRAYEIVGATPEMHGSMKVKSLVHADDAKRLQDIWQGLAEGVFPRGVDVRICRQDNEEVRTCTVSFSSLADAPDSALLTFQDVSEQRATEAELIKTMEFLESLIEASVDGIVAADLDGRIVLFNGGAERIYGYRAADVIGRLSTRKLYPPGEAERIMRRIRSQDFGGPGRLSASNVTAVDKNGEHIPIRLSAALIYEAGVPTATFGIFTDLRDRIRVETRLAEAQEKLALSEKHVLVAELAGTAAHELNQPLTSVMAYSELLARKLEEGTPEHRAASVMHREADRMADIVRKIGRMTRYETKTYVGEQRILDIDKASDDPA